MYFMYLYIYIHTLCIHIYVQVLNRNLLWSAEEERYFHKDGATQTHGQRAACFNNLLSFFPLLF